MAEKIEHNGKILAIIVRGKELDEMEEKGSQMLFATPDEFPFQMGAHVREGGTTITPHFHVPFPSLTDFPVQEFFYVVSGKMRIDLYDDRENDAKVAEVVVGEGDSIVLNTGHGFEFLEKSKLIEIKQGPYRGKDEEKRFF